MAAIDQVSQDRILLQKTLSLFSEIGSCQVHLFQKRWEKDNDTIQRKISKGRSADSNLFLPGIYVFTFSYRNQVASAFTITAILRWNMHGFDNFVRLFHDKFLKSIAAYIFNGCSGMLLIAVLRF